MFDNIGGKIRGLAKVISILGIIASIAVGLLNVIFSDEVGIIIIVVGMLISWISGFFIYGFGQLIEDAQAIRKSNAAILKLLQNHLKKEMDDK